MLDKEFRFLHDQLSWTIESTPHPDRDVTGLDHPRGRYAELLIVDEADRLKTPAPEQHRDHHDRTCIGVILIGMPGIEKRLAPQLYRRVGFVHHYRPLSATEQAFVLARHWSHLRLDDADDFATGEAVATVTRIISGNFRLTSRLIAQIEHVPEINQMSTVTKGSSTPPVNPQSSGLRDDQRAQRNLKTAFRPAASCRRFPATHPWPCGPLRCARPHPGHRPDRLRTTGARHAAPAVPGSPRARLSKLPRDPDAVRAAIRHLTATRPPRPARKHHVQDVGPW
ncbi:TniB family NTP-binding protein [Actinomadura sediminis]|uniref:ATP-binding protein n=1 Tax=Actinomadura sediminis TaxID=1038904 RepID=A0ABW3EHE3_9ACTN